VLVLITGCCMYHTKLKCYISTYCWEVMSIEETRHQFDRHQSTRGTVLALLRLSNSDSCTVVLSTSEDRHIRISGEQCYYLDYILRDITFGFLLLTNGELTSQKNLHTSDCGELEGAEGRKYKSWMEKYVSLSEQQKYWYDSSLH